MDTGYHGRLLLPFIWPRFLVLLYGQYNGERRVHGEDECTGKREPRKTSHRLTLDLWLAKDNRFLNPKSSYERF